MIQFNNVSKRYVGSQTALKNINFHLDKGEMAFLTGHSGAGKSTLLKLIVLLEKPTQGQIIVAGKNTSRFGRRKIPHLRRSLGMIVQNPQLLPTRTVFDNVALPLVIAGYPHQEIKRRVNAALDKVSLLDKEKKYPVSLSTGEQQRVGIARAVVNKPPLLIADEPTGNLDPGLAAEIMHLFEEFNRAGVSIFIASHNLTLIATMTHRVLTLKQGKLLGGSHV